MSDFGRALNRVSSSLLLLLFGATLVFTFESAAGQVPPSSSPFALHAGDRVVFYGDSITEQQYYTRDVELFAITRFPTRHIRFFNAGVSGDKVSGGGGGPIDQRLPRDLFALHPTVITVMLGMNDGYYKPFDPGVLTTFNLGYRHIVDQIQQNAAEAHTTLIGSSPYDEFTHPGGIAGYNDALIRLGQDVQKIGSEHKIPFVDFNAPVSAALKRAAELNPELSNVMIFDRVHPGQGIHWVMADALLKSWNAPAEVSSVTLDAVSTQATDTNNAAVADLRKGKSSLTWQTTEAALPLPLFVGQFAVADPVDALSLAAAPVIADLDQEMLIVHGLPEGTYSLLIDGRAVHSFSAVEFTQGVNLAVLPTPMLAQAQHVALLNDGKLNLDMMRNHLLRETQDRKRDELLEVIGASLDKSDETQWAAAQPVSHRFALEKVH